MRKSNTVDRIRSKDEAPRRGLAPYNSRSVAAIFDTCNARRSCRRGLAYQMARWRAAVVGVIGALSAERLRRLTTVKVEKPRTLAENEAVIAQDSRARPAAGGGSISAAGIEATVSGECQSIL
jgi:hypothetical protein